MVAPGLRVKKSWNPPVGSNDVVMKFSREPWKPALVFTLAPTAATIATLIWSCALPIADASVALIVMGYVPAGVAPCAVKATDPLLPDPGDVIWARKPAGSELVLSVRALVSPAMR